VVVLPLVLEEKVVGIFEAFSSRASAFGERDERTLEALAGRVLKNLERAAQPFEMAESASAEDAADRQSAEVMAPAGSRRTLDIMTWALGAVVLVSAVWLGTRAVQRFGPRRAGVQSAPAKAGMTGAQAGESASGRVEGVHSQQSPPAAATPASPKVPSGAGRRSSPSVPEGGLLVYENGREVFRMVPSPAQAVIRAEESGVQRASTIESEGIIKLAPEAVDDSLVYRVEPEYPEQARQQRIQGAVVLETRINPDGTVKDLMVASGQPLLADAAMAAVKQWRFRPHSVDGRQVEMQTRITIKFSLPAD
jgi:TonB family protein